MVCIPTLPSHQILGNPKNFSLPFRDPNLLGALHGEIISFDTQICLTPFVLSCLFILMATTFFILKKIRCGGLLVPLVGVGVGKLALSYFSYLLISSPCTHRICGLPCGHVANHNCSLNKLLHSLDSVILVRLG